MMIKKILFSILGFLVLQVQAQLLKPLGQGIPLIQPNDEVIATTTDSSFIYTATRHFNGTGKGYNVRVNKWNGFYWQQLPSITFGDSSQVKSIAVFKNQVYLAGNFTVKTPANTNTRTIVRFNNITNKWEAVTGNGGSGFSFLTNQGMINCMTVFKNQLYIAGYFYTVVNGNDSTQHIVTYNGTNFNRCGSGTTAANTGTNGQINSMLVLNDTLFIGGFFTKAGGVNSFNLAALDNNLSWKAISISSTGGVAKLTAYQNNLAILTLDAYPRIYIRSGSNYQVLTTNLSTPYQITDIEEYNNELWASGSFFSGSASIIKYSTGWNIVSLPVISVYELFKFKSGLYLVSSTDIAGSLRINKMAQIVFGQGRISGHIYLDGNHNCRYDNNISIDKPFSNKYIHVSGLENLNIATDSNGFYSATIPQGTYSISLVKFKNWTIDSPCTRSIYSNVTLNANNIFDTLDFSLKAIAIGTDIKINITPNNGFTSHRDLTEEYTVTYSNNGTQDLSNAAVKVVFNKKLSNFTSSQTPIVNGNEAIWSIPFLAVGQKRSLTFTAKAKADSFAVNDKVDFIASSALSDLDNTDNADTLVQRIAQGSATPVMKDIYPLPGLTDSFSLVSVAKNEISYLIHFENTTLTDTIHNIIVIDTIDVNSSIQYIQETGSSHPYTTKLYSCPAAMGKGVIVWTFSNINLPPFENSDDVTNRGHIGFKIQFNTSLPLGTIIKNRAYVIFDYYDPMKTNITYAKIADLNGINSRPVSYNTEPICANPVNNTIILLKTFDTKTTYRLINAAGALVLDGEIQSKTIDVKGLSTGIYFLMVENEKGIISQKIIIN